MMVSKEITLLAQMAVGNPFLPFCLRKLSPLFQLFYQSVKVSHGVVGPHHLYGIFLEVDFIYRPVDLEKVLDHGECGHMSKYF